jgi:tetratricopeptide (TPR) repeat protein
MIEILLALLSGLVVLLIFFRRWYLLEKSTLFGKMVFKKGFRLSGKITKDDHEITPKEMIPDQSSVAPKLIVKGDTYFKKAELELKKGNTSEAEKLYIKSIAMDPSHIESHAKLGAIYLNQKQFGKAELIYRKLIVAVSDDPIYFSNLGLSLFHQEKYPEAKDNYDQAIALDPNRAGRFYSLARINHLMNDMDDAFINIEKALNLDPDNLDYGLTLAHWQIEKNLNSEAKVLLENILRHWPENKEAASLLKELDGEEKQ